MAGCDQGKVEYKTERAAREAVSGLRANKRGCPVLRPYEHDGHWHITSSVTRLDKFTRPASHGPAPYTQSAAKLRRQLQNAAAQIAATERRLTAAEKEWFAELEFIERETERIMAGRNVVTRA
jgi:hypothetical protein